MKYLVNITQDHIRMLRNEGRYDEAKDLLKAYHEAGRDNMKNGRKENADIELIIFRHKLKYKKNK